MLLNFILIVFIWSNINDDGLSLIICLNDPIDAMAAKSQQQEKLKMVQPITSSDRNKTYFAFLNSHVGGVIYYLECRNIFFYKILKSFH